MIYRHNDIFIEDTSTTRAVSNYIYDLSIRCPLKCEAIPSVYLNTFSISANSLSARFSITCGKQSHTIDIRRSDLVTGAGFAISGEYYSIIGVTPVSGNITTKGPMRREPYKVDLIIADEDNYIVELNHKDCLNVSITDNTVKLNLNDPNPVGPDSTDGTILFVNGIPANQAGNVDIVGADNIKISVNPYKTVEN